MEPEAGNPIGASETAFEVAHPEDSLFHLLNHKCDLSQNYQPRKFLSVKAVEKWLTRDRIDKWIKQHPLHKEGVLDSFSDIVLINRICNKSCHLLFVALILANLEHLTAGLVGQGFTNSALFDRQEFEKACTKAKLSDREKNGLAKSRNRIGIVLEDSRLLRIPRDCILPYYKREWTDRAGSIATIYKVTVAPGHIKNNNKVRHPSLTNTCHMPARMMVSWLMSLSALLQTDRSGPTVLSAKVNGKNVSVRYEPFNKGAITTS